ncbi:spore germination protein [Jeotgalibacillus haloalkalitolerans]|uniref:Spore germination protein n=1 Tax=Jeotgalibacillus haloalkalitolerans TaxID=3104292 RepID=A0ABU5KLC6_9BACL|nr:spore germination protein [Jeotgalibacillus sp. HH7-29]MDZ5712058.1 spore germination protein [Jeotgalibacillus sp. HH7-29]
MRKLPKINRELDSRLKEAGLGVSFDFIVRKIDFGDQSISIYAVNGLCETRFIMKILDELSALHEIDRRKNFKGLVDQRIIHHSVEMTDTEDELIRQVFSGLIALKIDGEDECFLIDVRSYPGRQPEEPDTEKVVRGSRDGFVENIIVNTALTRRRIRDKGIRFEMLEIGERSKMDVAVGYIEGIANPELVDIIKKEIEQIHADGLVMTDKSLEEYIVKQGFNPYPLVRFTERADIAAEHLLEGHICIYIDTSPSVIIAPSTFFHHVQHAEEYRQSPAAGTMLRFIRFTGIAASIVLLPLWYLLAIDPALKPESLSFIGVKEEAAIPLILQLLLADIGIEFLRMAAIHTPTPLSTAMGLIAAVLIGQIAIDVGLFVPEVILYVAVASIGTFATPSYELSIANKFSRIFLILLVGFFHTTGFIIGFTLLIVFLAQMRVFTVPYLWPLLPFRPLALLQVITRVPVTSTVIRPMIVKAEDRIRQKRSH